VIEHDVHHGEGDFADVGDAWSAGDGYLEGEAGQVIEWICFYGRLVKRVNFNCKVRKRGTW
jgi:hypothetical protein